MTDMDLIKKYHREARKIVAGVGMPYSTSLRAFIRLHASLTESESPSFDGLRLSRACRRVLSPKGSR